MRILGGLDNNLPQHAEQNEVLEVFIVVPSASGEQIRKIVGLCKSCGVKFKILPRLGELIDGRVSIKALRDVDYQDLLGRSPVDLDKDGISSYFNEKRVLVTGPEAPSGLNSAARS